MKAITLWQPWATLIAIGAKKYETRGWATRYRGDLVIHSSAKNDREIYDDLRQYDVQQAMRENGYHEPMPFGCPLCVVTLVDCIPTEHIPKAEWRLGNFGEGRYGWLVENVRLFEKPFRTYKGAQGLWDFPDHLIKLAQS